MADGTGLLTQQRLTSLVSSNLTASAIFLKKATMLIKLTNASGTQAGQPVILNTDVIVSVFPVPAEFAEAAATAKTLIFCPPHGTWQVENTVEEVFALISK